ncbi:hypothetical protein FB451DRAFT_1551424 [Mycena latifolia]|nr:hypothetical protein FB451DRAFT_1551424 [Mycena latifolia]
MAGVPETSLSLITSAPPTSTSTRVLIAMFSFALAACALHHTSPMRLARVLVTAITAAEKTYLEAIEDGVLPKSNVEMATTLTRLQLKVSIIREACLRHSLSHRTAICEFFKGHTIIVLQCIWEVRGFETHIEILKEVRLRDCGPDLPASESATRTVSLRQRKKNESTGLKLSKY